MEWQINKWMNNMSLMLSVNDGNKESSRLESNQIVKALTVGAQEEKTMISKTALLTQTIMVQLR